MSRHYDELVLLAQLLVNAAEGHFAARVAPIPEVCWCGVLHGYPHRNRRVRLGEKWSDKGWVEWGTSAAYPWLLPEGVEPVIEAVREHPGLEEVLQLDNVFDLARTQMRAKWRHMYRD